MSTDCVGIAVNGARGLARSACVRAWGVFLVVVVVMCVWDDGSWGCQRTDRMFVCSVLLRKPWRMTVLDMEVYTLLRALS